MFEQKLRELLGRRFTTLRPVGWVDGRWSATWKTRQGKVVFAEIKGNIEQLFQEVLRIELSNA